MALRRTCRVFSRSPIAIKTAKELLDFTPAHRHEPRDFHTSSPAHRKMPNSRKPGKIKLDEEQAPENEQENPKPEAEKIQPKKSVSIAPAVD